MTRSAHRRCARKKEPETDSGGNNKDAPPANTAQRRQMSAMPGQGFVDYAGAAASEIFSGSGASPSKARAKASPNLRLLKQAKLSPKAGGRRKAGYQWMRIGVRLIIEYPCAAPPNIKRAFICASVFTRNVGGPISGPRRIFRYSGYVCSVYAPSRTTGKRPDSNSNFLHSIYWGSLIVIICVFVHHRLVALNSNISAAWDYTAIPRINWIKLLVWPCSCSRFAVNIVVRSASY